MFKKCVYYRLSRASKHPTPRPPTPHCTQHCAPHLPGVGRGGGSSASPSEGWHRMKSLFWHQHLFCQAVRWCAKGCVLTAEHCAHSLRGTQPLNLQYPLCTTNCSIGPSVPNSFFLSHLYVRAMRSVCRAIHQVTCARLHISGYT